MAGPSGLTTNEILDARQKCGTSPTKKQYTTQAAAEEAAVWRTREAGISIQAYACPDCGYFHLSRTSRLDRVLPQIDGAIQTASMRRQILAPARPERADMSEIIAMETPVVAGNRAAREKLLAEYLEGKESVTVPEVSDYLQGSRYIATSTLNALGWEGRKGQAEWYPAGVMPQSPPKPESIERMKRRKAKPSSRDAVRRARKRKLKLYLVEHPEVTTIEVMELLECGKDMAKHLLTDAGWHSGWGPNAKWTTGEDKLAHRRTVKPEEPETMNEPIDLAVHRHPAGRDIQSDQGWRPVPSLEALLMKQVTTIIEELGVYGLEMRIEIREKR